MSENDVPQAKSKPRYVPNRLGKDQLIDDENHVYNCNKRTGNKAFWICSEKQGQKCSATASVVKAVIEGDGTLAEINPLVVTSAGEFIAGDAKIEQAGQQCSHRQNFAREVDLADQIHVDDQRFHHIV